MAKMLLVAAEEREGLLDSLPPWGLLIAGVVLLGLALGGYTLYKKAGDDGEDGPFFLEVVSFLFGVAGVIAIWRGLFG